MVAVAFSSAAGAVSISATDQPCCAKTWAMPLPMVPAPMTAARLMSGSFRIHRATSTAVAASDDGGEEAALGPERAAR